MPKLIHRLFEGAADRTPEAVALYAGERRIGFAALDRAAEDVVLLLRRQGLIGRGPFLDARLGLCARGEAGSAAGQAGQQADRRHAKSEGGEVHGWLG